MPRGLSQKARGQVQMLQSHLPTFVIVKEKKARATAWSPCFTLFVEPETIPFSVSPS
jgi:hypothetical protein